MKDPRYYSLLFHRLPHVGAVTFSQLLERFGTAESALHQPLSVLQPLVKPETLAAIREFQLDPTHCSLTQKVCADLDWLEAQADTHLIFIESPQYPALLRQIPKAPPMLFVRGNVDCLHLPQIAIVGSRNPTSGGSDNAHRFAEFLASNGFAITSGLALGVDAAAHQGALNVQGKTIAVMGTGVDLIYPSRHRQLAHQIIAQGGALVSELPLGSSANAANFPQRNRIISGLSGGVLVVEAAIQSGSLITAQTAVQQNREVFAIPGSIHNPLARGCHQLIRQGATLVETAQDIVSQLDGMLAFQRDRLQQFKSAAQQRAPAKQDTVKPAQGSIEAPSLDMLSPAEQQLLEAIGFDPVSIDDLVERTNLAVGSISAQLIGLEIKGFVQPVGAGYQRI